MNCFYAKRVKQISLILTLKFCVTGVYELLHDPGFKDQEVLSLGFFLKFFILIIELNGLYSPFFFLPIVGCCSRLPCSCWRKTCDFKNGAPSMLWPGYWLGSVSDNYRKFFLLFSSVNFLCLAWYFLPHPRTALSIYLFVEPPIVCYLWCLLIVAICCLWKGLLLASFSLFFPGILELSFYSASE